MRKRVDTAAVGTRICSLNLRPVEPDGSVIRGIKNSGDVLPRLFYGDPVHLRVSENALFSFLALFAARFSIKVLSGFFLFCFLLSWPLLMGASPYIRVR